MNPESRRQNKEVSRKRDQTNKLENIKMTPEGLALKE